MKPPLQFQEKYGLPTQMPAPKMWRAWYSYCGPYKKEMLSIVQSMEQSGCLAEVGDPGNRAERVSHAELGFILGISRETYTKRWMMFAGFGEGCLACSVKGQHTVPCKCDCHGFDPEWRPDALCKCHQPALPRRECASQKMQAIAANHPHWNKESDSSASAGTGALDTGSLSEIRHQTAVNGKETPGPVSSPRGEKEAGALEGERGRRANRDGVRARKHVGAILARNAGFAVPNSYALACTDGKRPGLSAGYDQVGFLERTFGAHMFSREKQTWLDERQSLNGFRRAGWFWHPNMPTDRDCECVRGQLKLGFQEICPKCEGDGYIITSPFFGKDKPGMTDYCKVMLQFLFDRGLDEEFRRCGEHRKTFAGNECCPECHSRGYVLKKRGELNGAGSGKYTEEDIAAACGLHVSTVQRNLRTCKRIGMIRTAPGAVYWKCEKCPHPLFTEKKCPGCGTQPIGAPKKRDPQLIILISSRTLDKQIAAAELRRLDAVVKWHRRWLDKRHQADLEAAVELAKKVLNEWEGHEHLLISFYNEMRRRLAASKLRANLVNVLFPLQRE